MSSRGVYSLPAIDLQKTIRAIRNLGPWIRKLLHIDVLMYQPPAHREPTVLVQRYTIRFLSKL